MRSSDKQFGPRSGPWKCGDNPLNSLIFKKDQILDKNISKISADYKNTSCQLIIVENSMDPDQASQNIGPGRPQGYKTFFMLNLAEHEIYPAH